MKRQSRALWRLGLALIFTIAAGIIQNTNLFNAYGVKPNLTLAVLIALSFFITNFFYYLILILAAGIFLRFEAVFELTNIVFVMIALTVYWLKARLPGRQFLNNIFLVAGSTWAFYLLSDFTFLNSYPLTVMMEMIYNILLGALTLLVSRRLLFHEKGFRTSL